MPTNAVRLRRGDLDETLAAVGIMKASLRRDGVVSGRFARRPTIRGVPLDFSPSNAPVRPIDVRARVAGCDLAISQIFLDPVPMVREHGAAFVQEVDRLDRWLGPVLAHEIEHVLQKISGEDDMLEAVREAHALSKAAMSSRDLSAYLAYLGHPLEVAAHAAQLAMEVMITAGEGLDGAGFNAAAEASDLHARVQEEARQPMMGPSWLASGPPSSKRPIRRTPLFGTPGPEPPPTRPPTDSEVAMAARAGTMGLRGFL